MEAVPLFTSTGDAWSMREEFYTNPDIPYLFERDAAETKGIKILGASLTGIFPSWFRDKPRPQANSGLDLPDMPSEAKPARLIVIGDTDFVTSFINVTGGQRNLDFILQAADWLGNDDDIIGIRNRDSRSGRLDRIIEPEKRIPVMRFAQFINIILVPLLVIVAGIFFALRRRANAQIRSGTGVEESVETTVKEHSDGV